MEKWQKILAQSITNISSLKQFFPADEKELIQVVERYPFRLNPYFLKLIKQKDDPIWKQCIPDYREIADQRGRLDPLKEEKYSPLPGLIHRYPGRALLLASNVCAGYCRFCTRKRKVGHEYITLKEADIKRALDYIKKHKEIRDVVISGGDPLLLNDKKLEHYLKSISAIKHVEIIRIDSRIPAYLPQRITPKLCNMLRKYKPIYFHTHFNHPRELTREAKKACQMLADAGVVLGNQSVLLKGVNDDAQILKKLGEELLKVKVRPYYLYLADAVKGTYHFRVSIKRALKIMKSLIGFTSGLAVPKLIIDLENGGGKLPLLPNYVMFKAGKLYAFKNFEGRKFLHYDV